MEHRRSAHPAAKVAVSGVCQHQKAVWHPAKADAPPGCGQYHLRNGCRVVRLGDLKEKKRPHHVEKQLTNNSCWKGNWKTTSFNRDNGKLKISEVEQTALYLQSLQIESCLLLAIRFSDTDSWCPCILVLGYSIFSWLFRNCVYSSKKSITDAL